MTSHLSDDVIGSICSGYVPFHTVELIATAFSEMEVAWMIDMSVVGSFRQTLCETIAKFLASEKTNPRRVSNHGPLGRNITKRTFFHCTSRPRPIS